MYLKPPVVKPGQSWQGETAHSSTAYPSVRWFFRMGATLFGQKELEIKKPLQFGWFIVLNGGMSRGISSFKSHDFIFPTLRNPRRPVQARVFKQQAGTLPWSLHIIRPTSMRFKNCSPHCAGFVFCWPIRTLLSYKKRGNEGRMATFKQDENGPF